MSGEERNDGEKLEAGQGTDAPVPESVPTLPSEVPAPELEEDAYKVTLPSFHGPLEIHGTVDGNAVAIGGNVELFPGARVHGDGLSVGGLVLTSGGTVPGETRPTTACSHRATAAAQEFRPPVTLH